MILLLLSIAAVVLYAFQEGRVYYSFVTANLAVLVYCSIALITGNHWADGVVWGVFVVNLMGMIYMLPARPAPTIPDVVVSEDPIRFLRYPNSIILISDNPVL